MRSNMTMGIAGLFYRSRGLGAVSQLAAIGALCLMAAAPASATYDPAHQFITNGGFETTTNGLGQLVTNTNATGWTSLQDGSGNAGYNFVMNGATASSVGADGIYGNLTLWGPGSSPATNNGLQASPTGGNFLAADGAYQTGKITQALTGLIVGQTYTLTFNFAGAQQEGYDGATTETWKFGLNSLTQQSTATLNNVNHGFTGWQTQTYNFVATNASDTLYFLAQGTPTGQPPFSLLDSVSLVGGFGTVSAAPDPATWMTLVVGFGLIGFSLRVRPRNRNATAFAAA